MRRNKNLRVQKEAPKLAFPWSTEYDYFNSDMFEDWINSKLDPDGPYFKLQQMIKAREAAIYRQCVDEFTKILKKTVLERGIHDKTKNQ